MKKLVSVLVSATILAIIYWKVGPSGLQGALERTDRALLTLGLMMVLPLTAISAWRFRQLMPARQQLGSWEATKLILVASSLNMVLPSKMGDIAKAYFMTRGHRIRGGFAVSLVLFEKSIDMLALLFWCTFGLLWIEKNTLFWILTTIVAVGLTAGMTFLLSTRLSGQLFRMTSLILPGRFGHRLDELNVELDGLRRYFSDRWALALRIAALSLFLWFLHLVQIWIFVLSLGARMPLLDNLALAPLAILAGLAPLTFAGIGSRDAAIVLLYQPFLPSAAGAALGLLYTSRYFIPALLGLPFLSLYLSDIRRASVGGR